MIMGLCVYFYAFFDSFYRSWNGRMYVYIVFDENLMTTNCISFVWWCGIKKWRKKQGWIHENKSHTWLLFVERFCARLQKFQEQSNALTNMQQRVAYKLWPLAMSSSVWDFCVNEFKCECQVIANEMFRSWPWPWSHTIMVAIPRCHSRCRCRHRSNNEQLQLRCLSTAIQHAIYHSRAEDSFAYRIVAYAISCSFATIYSHLHIHMCMYIVQLHKCVSLDYRIEIFDSSNVWCWYSI